MLQGLCLVTTPKRHHHDCLTQKNRTALTGANSTLWLHSRRALRHCSSLAVCLHGTGTSCHLHAVFRGKLDNRRFATDLHGGAGRYDEVSRPQLQRSVPVVQRDYRMAV